MHIDFHSFIRSIIKTIEAKDIYTAGHSDRVADIAENIARSANLPESEIEIIHIAGHLHDIGKIGIPDGILMKTSILAPEEYSLIKRHAVIGWEILSEKKEFCDIASIVKAHHERPDGKGYPEGLIENKIPKLSGIISVADVYDAITTNRTYKVSKPPEAAVNEIISLKGFQFTEFAVEAFENYIVSENYFYEDISKEEGK